jgi:flagellar basal-body rod modification protein FlgD
MAEFDISALPPGLVRQPTGANSQARPTDELGQEAFLKLMLTQLKNQDPFEPLESGEFLGQIAQFSTVSGIQELQAIMTGVSSSITSDRSLRAASLLGRSVLVESAEGYLDLEEGLNGAVELQQSAESVLVEILDLSGARVGSVELGASASGLNSFSFNGIGSSGAELPAGRYRIRATAMAGGKSVSLQTLVSQRVAGVQITPGETDLTLDLAGGGSVVLGNVRRID